MSRLAERFRILKHQRRKALVVFVTAGDPDLRKTEGLIGAFDKEGVDVIELGVPFSDPLADGPVIQASSQRSLKRGTTLKKILALARRARRRTEVPLVLMSYLNPVLRYGLERFARDAQKAGVDGLIVPDLPPEEERGLSAAMKRRGLDLIYLVAPTSTARRRGLIAKASRGFLYYVSLTGVTGTRSALPGSVGRDLRRVTKVSRLPVCVGFGVSTPQQAKALSRWADGVIVGSAVVRSLAGHPRLSAPAFTKKFIRPFARALGKERSRG